MNLSAFSVKRPYLVFAVLVAILVFGGISLSRLPVDLLPQFSLPSMIIMIPYPGAGPQEVEKNVVDEAERWLGTISGIEEIESDAADNLAFIHLTFDWGVDPDMLTTDVRDKLDIAMSWAPDEVGDPTIIQLDASFLPQMMIGVSGGADAIANREVARDIGKRLRRINNIAAADVIGGEEREISVSIDRRKLTTYGIHPAHIEGVLAAHNINYPLGSIEEQGREMELRLVAEYDDLAELEQTIVGSKGDIPVYLADVARVSWSKTDENSAFSVNGVPGVSIMIHKTSGANTVRISNALRGEIDDIRKNLPEGMAVTILYDSARFVKSSLSSTFWNLLAGAVLAALVLFLFLGRLRRTAFVGAAIPLSVFIALVGVELAGYKIDILSLAGFTVAIGMVVDASIVVFESIHRYNTMGYSPGEAAVKGTREVGGAIFASTLTTVAVFVPLLFLKGFVSLLFQEFSWVMILTLAASLLVALTFIPMAASRFMKEEQKKTRLAVWFDAGYAWLERVYEKFLNWSLRHRVYAVFLGVSLFALSLMAMFYHQKDFFPDMDMGEIMVDITAPAGTSLDEMKARVDELEMLVVDSIPELDLVQTAIGGGEGFISSVRGVSGKNAQMTVYLVKKTKRKRSSKDVEEWIREKAKNIPGLEITPAAQTLGSIAFGAEDLALGGTTPIVVEIEGYDLEAADSIGLLLADSLRMIPGLVDVRTSAQDRRPSYSFNIRRDLASRFGITPYELGRILRTELTGAVATSYSVEGDEYDVRVRLASQDRSSMDRIEALEISTPAGMVPLSNMVTIKRASVPSAIHHKGTRRIRSVGASLKDRDLGSASDDVRALIKRLEPGFPPGLKVSLTGGFTEMSESFSDLWWVILMAAILVYLIMMAQFGSFRFPFIIMFTLPLALIGGIAMLVMTGTSVNTFSLLGFIVLVGVVVNNGIVFIDYTNKLRREEGMGLEEALRKAGKVRMRPILMTAFTTVFGLLPMAIGIGEGTELTTPIARPVLGGLIAATFLTLIFIPVLYHLFEKPRESRRKRNEAEVKVNKRKAKRRR
ncbi:MMPL family transporter [candidate division WOR-3 bacterium]|uniref:MMPL family transporter n=1 Tax=candidate division WOR-3 bacterium TaxID=2052148 RepID=A0A9D5K7I0_UNCW3|nr:MMPL family transporter [candidate division WOR-3 bacterium]MBD3363768.1 MMPL family transporter [candidate division WOR-3 bacterium]